MYPFVKLCLYLPSFLVSILAKYTRIFICSVWSVLFDIIGCYAYAYGMIVADFLLWHLHVCFYIRALCFSSNYTRPVSYFMSLYWIQSSIADIHVMTSVILLACVHPWGNNITYHKVYGKVVVPCTQVFPVYPSLREYNVENGRSVHVSVSGFPIAAGVMQDRLEINNVHGGSTT